MKRGGWRGDSSIKALQIELRRVKELRWNRRKEEGGRKEGSKEGITIWEEGRSRGYIGGKEQRKRGGEEGMRRVREANRRSCEEREGQVEVRIVV